MPTDKERREVAQRLRNMGYDDTKESLICAYLDALGVEGEWLTWVEIAHRLADLIEPGEPKVKCVAEVKVDGERLEELAHDAAVELAGIDRDELLALADEMEFDGAGALDDEDWCKPLLIEYARRIREALGVDDGR